MNHMYRTGMRKANQSDISHLASCDSVRDHMHVWRIASGSDTKQVAKTLNM
jgi:hypothetical protein